jgi:Family of unknown function (DUF6459)
VLASVRGVKLTGERRPADRSDRQGGPSPWGACLPAASSGAGGPPVSAASVLRLGVHELQLGLVDAVAGVRRGQRVAFTVLRLEAIPGRWEVIELPY